VVVEVGHWLSMEHCVVSEPGIGRNGTTPGGLEIEPTTGLLAGVECGREAPRCARWALPLANVGDLHLGSLGPRASLRWQAPDGVPGDIMTTDMRENVPFQVQLTRGQHRRLKRLAESRGVSMGSILRESVADYLANARDAPDPAFGIIGLIDDDGPTPHGDPAAEHDAYLADALEAESSVAERPRR
jgi:hypothetical protein